MLLIDTGALAGTVLGLGVGFLATGNIDGDSMTTAIGVTTLVGLYAGLASAIYLTSDMDSASDRDMSAQTVPALIALDQGGRWGFGRLALAPVLGPAGQISGAMAPLVGGAF